MLFRPKLDFPTSHELNRPSPAAIVAAKAPRPAQLLRLERERSAAIQARDTLQAEAGTLVARVREGAGDRAAERRLRQLVAERDALDGEIGRLRGEILPLRAQHAERVIEVLAPTLHEDATVAIEIIARLRAIVLRELEAAVEIERADARARPPRLPHGHLGQLEAAFRSRFADGI
ncbi:hypothetical protein E8L99_09080 [Phreatobacter aquaticus]|uniref:Uncharacterized protein n=1 Tax=Phreatobacter aquaticus TaxID=2570229 RepID=A0A4D7QP37_9HYPH|nr:hypothetical protein [Phreatobacter aquaticus]QCK85902.1 hypothetical protein E8L99_09080 [Phreatobacter aquaticus]